MEFLSRFKKKTAEPEPDSLEVSQKKWQESETLLTNLEKLQYKITLKTTARLENGDEIEYLPGIELVIVPPRDSGPEGSQVHYSTQAQIFVASVERNQEGLLAPAKRLLYHFEPGSQQLFDYTDPESPKGKIISDTASDSFKYVSKLIALSRQGERRLG
ncbi:hypothetical protein H0W80_00595 [Candidatus Saccharibacteria bacterium]|nr:hypothetical protein [Candidatus Saccharibacteria bacterium]